MNEAETTRKSEFETERRLAAMVQVALKEKRPTLPTSALKPEFLSLVTDCWHADPRSRPCSFDAIWRRLEPLGDAFELAAPSEVAAR
jgi:hypothetical protein